MSHSPEPAATAQVLARARGAGGAVMAVGDVQRRHRRERRHERAASSPAATRQTVCCTPSAAVKSNSGARRGRPLHDGVDGRRRAIDREHRPGLRAQLDDVPRAIVFLVPARALVLLDDVARRTRRQRSSRRCRSARALPSAAGRRRGVGASSSTSGACAFSAPKFSTAFAYTASAYGFVPRGRSISARETCRKLSGLPAASARASSVLTTS